MPRLPLILAALTLLAGAPPEPANWTHAWQAWHPGEGPAAAMAPLPRSRPPALRIQAAAAHSVAAWRTVVRDIRPGQAYEFSVPYRTRGIADEHYRVYAVLSWCADAEGRRPIQRDYAHRERDGAGGVRLRRVLSAPAGAVSLRIELGLRGAGQGTAWFFEPRLDPVATPPARRVRVAVTHGHPDPKAAPAERLAQIASWIDQAGAAGSELIVLPETIFDYGLRGPYGARAMELAGPAHELLSSKARQYRSYVVAGAYEVRDGATYNVALLYDRAGRLAGSYRKTHLPLSETESGIAPGGDFPVFETDFGTIGLLVCWDLWFPEPARILRLRGARMIVAPLAGDVVPRHWDVMTRARALDNAIPLAVAAAESVSPSRIVDANGELLAETAPGSPLAVAEVDLNGASRVRWLSVGDALGDPASLYLQERRPGLYGALSADPARLPLSAASLSSTAPPGPSSPPKAGARPAARAASASPQRSKLRTPSPPTPPQP